MRLLNQSDPDTTYSDAARRTVIVRDDKIFSHKTIHVNYTTYDGCRARDCLSVRKGANILVLSHEDRDETEQNSLSSRYWYAQIAGIFHAYVYHLGSLSRTNEPQRIEFLWVRWYGTDPGFRAGWKVVFDMFFYSAHSLFCHRNIVCRGSGSSQQTVRTPSDLSILATLSVVFISFLHLHTVSQIVYFLNQVALLVDALCLGDMTTWLT